MGTMERVEKTVSWVARQRRKRVPYADDNPFLQGAYAPVAAEIDATALPVRGRIPRELNGLYARIGPNPLRVDNPATHHWFLGTGMVHGVRLREGRAVSYRNRWVADQDVCPSRFHLRPCCAAAHFRIAGTRVTPRVWGFCRAPAAPPT